jgi:signal transduction histidine kinase
MRLHGVKISVKLTALVILSVCLTALASGLLAIFIGRSIIRERMLEANINSVQSYAGAIGFYLDNARSVLEIAAELRGPNLFTSSELNTSAQHRLTAKTDIPERQIAADILSHSKVFEYVMLLRADGSVYLVEPYELQQGLSRSDVAFTPWYKKLLGTGKTTSSDLRISIVTQRPTVIVATPILRRDGRIAGIWAGGLRLEELSKIGHGGQESGALQRWGYITDSRGLIVAHQANPKYVQEQTDFSSVSAVRAALAGQQGAGEWFNTVEDSERLGAYMPLPDLGWAVVYTTPTIVAYAPIDKLTQSIFLASVALFVLMGSAGWAIAGRITRPLKTLALATEEIAAGDYTRRIEVGSGDEFERLAGKFNQMAQALSQKEAQLRQRNEQLQQANRLKSEFLANMSHELRTPLNAIIGFAELMHDGKVGPVSSDHKEYLGDVLGSARHLLQLINDVLDLSKVEAGKMEFNPEPVNLKKIINEVRQVLQSLTASKRLLVEVEVSPAVEQLIIDPAKLKQVLYNYLSNAIKFTPEQGRISVRALAEGADSFRLAVEDSGIGIRQDEIGKLFVEFQQLEAGTTKKHQGTGLGLALTKKIVEAQGGHVGVRSTPQRGSVFYVVLPRIAEQTKAITAPELLSVSPATDGPAVLVIEDNETTGGG